MTSRSLIWLCCGERCSDEGASEISALEQSGEDSTESQRCGTGVSGLESNAGSVSGCGLRLDGEKVLGDSVAFKFSAEIKQREVVQDEV